MSTITVTNIKATGETASRSVSGVAAAWVNWNGTGTAATRDSFNNSSLTDNGTGDYTLGLTSAMGNSNYATAGGIDQVGYAINVHFNTLTTTSIRVQADRDGLGSANYVWDWSFLTTIAHGDLA